MQTSAKTKQKKQVTIRRSKLLETKASLRSERKQKDVAFSKHCVLCASFALSLNYAKLCSQKITPEPGFKL